MFSAEDRKFLLAAPGTIMGFFLSMNPLLIGLLVLQFLDIATGFLAAAVNGKVSSDVSRRGFMKKVLTLCLVLALKALGHAISLDWDLAAMTAGWFCITEIISIAENVHRAGVPLPTFLTKTLKQIQQQADPPATIAEKKGE